IPANNWLHYDSSSHILRGLPSALDLGSYPVVISAFDAFGGVQRDTFNLQVLNQSFAGLSRRFNAGDSDYTSSNNILFSTDQGLSTAPIELSSQNILATNEPALYQSQRRADTINYQIPLPNGQYQVMMHFAETRQESPALEFDYKNIYQRLEASDTLAFTQLLTSNDGSQPTEVSLSMDNPLADLLVNGQSLATAQTLDLSQDSLLNFSLSSPSLSPGVYTYALSASAPGYETARFQLVLEVVESATSALQINFQKNVGNTPTGWLRDYGQAYGPRTGSDQGSGLEYGWLDAGTSSPLDLTTWGRVRPNDNTPVTIDNSLMHLQPSGTDAKWEIALENGWYEVEVSAGDPNFYDSQHLILVEGQGLIHPYTPDASNPLISDQALVQVNDGRLTISAEGGSNTKINYIRIQPQDLKINFQSDIAAPPGWQRDIGYGFAGRNEDSTFLGMEFGWREVANTNPLDISDRGRYRDVSAGDSVLRSFMHMQHSAESTDGKWELTVANGWYEVESSVGDLSFFDSDHLLRAEGITLLAYNPTSSGTQSGTSLVQVTDGLLTLDPVGGTNTKINFARVRPGSGPAVREVKVSAAGDKIEINRFDLPGGSPLDAATITTTHVQLLDSTGASLPASLSYQNGIISLSPNDLLAPGQSYQVQVSSGVLNQNGLPIQPFSYQFALPNELVLPRLNFSSEARYVSLIKGNTRDFELGISTSNGQTPALTLSATGNPSWLKLGANDFSQSQSHNLSTNDTISLQLDASSLDAGLYQSQLTASVSGYESVSLNLELLVVDTNLISYQISFQDTITTAPSGWLRDMGDAYGLRTVDGQGDGTLLYGWLEEANPQTPLNLRRNGRNRFPGTISVDSTLIHMQGGDIVPTWVSGVLTQGRWEMELDNGLYEVMVGAGDLGSDNNSMHQLNVEGLSVLTYDENAAPSAAPAYDSLTIRLLDGKLTMDAQGGTNTKPVAITMRPSRRPTVADFVVLDQGTGICITDFITLGGATLDTATLNATNVYVTLAGDSQHIPLSLSWLSDTLKLEFQQALARQSNYTLHLSAGVQDSQGRALFPFSHTFNTGANPNIVADQAAVFDIIAEGSTQRSNYNVAQAAGGSLRAITESFSVQVNDQSLDLSLSSDTNHIARMAAMEIYPYLYSPIPDTTIRIGEAFTLNLKAETPNDQLRFELELPLNSWLHFDSTTCILSGVPGCADEGLYPIQLTAVFQDSVSIPDAFRIWVSPSADTTETNPQFNGEIVAYNDSIAGAYPCYHTVEQTFTVYSQAAPGNVSYCENGQGQRYLQNRVSYTYTYNKSQPDSAVYTYYSYDPHGNVEWIVQEIPGISRKSTAYEYDLISGKVLKVRYNECGADRFYHKYDYDEDNRLLAVYTSRDGYLWDRDASYAYYEHGPLQRVELGEDKIQGLDYAYTIQGWLKGINGPSPQADSLDMGQDGSGASDFAPDEWGMALGYYEGDYTSKNA
ncbi:MAG: malectin domain-containing carbohydrate-binding protein, partial [Bacteroidota bacterium]